MMRRPSLFLLPFLLGCTPGGFYALDPGQRRVVLDVVPTEPGAAYLPLRLVAHDDFDDLEIRLYLGEGWRFGSPEMVLEDAHCELLMGWLESPDRIEPIRDWWLLGDREALCGYVHLEPGVWRVYAIVERTE